jgi:Cd2+/Zn2+-exporting ATPase
VALSEPNEPAGGTGNALKMRVEGMDCSACAIKVENALKRLPGVSDINMNYSTETLSVRLDENRTSRTVVEGKIRALGYTPKSLTGPVSGASDTMAEDEQAPGDQPWWRTRTGRLVLGLGGLLALAFAISIVRPELSHWAYGAAALVGLVPIARRAAVGALSGTPFSIETLMTVAAAGAIAIGAAEEAAVVLFLFAIGELLEKVAAGRARAGIKALVDLVPRTARIEEGGQLREVPVERLRVGDVVVVRPGDRVPSDGSVIEGQSEVDEAPVTGESVPVARASATKYMPAASMRTACCAFDLRTRPLTIRSPASFIWLKKPKARKRPPRALSIGSPLITPPQPWQWQRSSWSDHRSSPEPIGTPGSIEDLRPCSSPARARL